MAIRTSFRTKLGIALSLPLVLVIISIVNESNRNLDNEVFEKNINETKLNYNEDISLISWNLQFAGSRKHHFFYDGGKAVSVPKEDIIESLTAIKKVLKREDTKIALLQEIDRFSDRTQNIDQLDSILEYRPELNWSLTPYHKVPYVPTPNHEHMGRVNLNLGILSVFTLENTKRHQLALLDEPKWRQYFNLRRAILESSIPLEDNKRTLRLAVTHLSAFSNGDGTLHKQVAQVKQWMASQPPDQPWILAGDFNLLPPGDNPQRLGDDASLYADNTNPIEDIIPEFNIAFKNYRIKRNRTYLPFGATKPDRKIDYIFYGGPIEIRHTVVLRDQSHVSDHLPLKIIFRITDPDAAIPEATRENQDGE